MELKKRGVIYVVLGVFFLFLASFAAADVGCFTYPQASEDVYCFSGTDRAQAQLECDDFVECDMDTDFHPNVLCSEFAECEQVTCDVDCSTHALGKCEALGGSVVPDDQFDFYCSLGCCKIEGGNFCQFGLNWKECQLTAAQKGVTNPSDIIFDNSFGIDSAACQNLYCQVDVTKGILQVRVTDENGIPLENAQIELLSTTFDPVFTDPLGNAIFTDLNPGSYLVQASSPDFLPSTSSITVASGETTQVELALSSLEANAILTGRVMNSQGDPVEGATILYEGIVSNTVSTNAQGEYQITLPEGDYDFTASKIGFTQDVQSATLTLGENAIDFTIDEVTFSGITGVVYLDANNNNELDSADAPRPGARIYLDGIFKGFSGYPNGNFELSTDSTVSHELRATYQDYQVLHVTSPTDDPTASVDLLLTTFVGECTEAGTEKQAENFIAGHVLGSKAVHLSWDKPCPEVVGYTIVKFIGDKEIARLSASPTQATFIDEDVEWDTTYSYKIIAYYDEGRFVEGESLATITLGDEYCEGKYHEETGWETFCLTDSQEQREIVWTCSEENRIVPALDCGVRSLDDQVYYCAKVDIHKAECKDAGVCKNNAGPFELYHTRDQCYIDIDSLGLAESFCYYDYTSTIIDQCSSCVEVENCFDYKSEDACNVNNCLTSNCRWVDGAAQSDPIIDYGLINLPASVTPETGHGYCVEEGYDEDKYCSKCDPTSTLFENYFCTAEVCSSLGACFSSHDLTSCETCGEFSTKNANCYTYGTELECTGGRSISKDESSFLTYSLDQCGWGSCSWVGISGGAGSCIKDSNADGIDDCSVFESKGEIQWCRIDTSAPLTTILPEGVNTLSLASPFVAFHGDDSIHADESQRNKMGELFLCLRKEGSVAPCNFEDLVFSYPGIQQIEDIELNVVDLLEENTKPQGQTYEVLFYSTDKYFNREQLRRSYFFIDNVPPAFSINEDIVTEGETTQLTVHLDGEEEPMSCSFSLEPLFPSSKLLVVDTARDEDKVAEFSDLNAVHANLTVACQDDQGNTNTQSKLYTFDLEERIDIITPEFGGAVRSTEISFEVETAASTHCSLYQTATNVKLADFVSENGFSHKTPLVSGFVEGVYSATQKVICRELLTGDEYEDYFDFTVDFTAPQTQIILREGSREERPTVFDWERFFIQSASVDFECVDDGFACDQTFYCLGFGCDFIGDPKYQEFNGTLTLTESTRICYYSTDTGGNKVFPLCGEVIVDGFGIILEIPLPHYYEENVWGISPITPFEWQFSTRIPTTECHFDFTPGFDFDGVPQHKILYPDSNGKYYVPNFPENAFTSYDEDGGVKATYIQCIDSEGVIGPEEVFFLEYDPSQPQIVDAFADPDEVFDGISTEIIVETDDKTLCRYSDNSDGMGSTEYATMGFKFPGNDGRELHTEHTDTFMITSVGDTGIKDYVLTTQCVNGAGVLSDVRNITFHVDYTQVGFIIPSSLLPQGSVNYAEITLSLETSKNAICEYKKDGSYVAMEGAGGRTHSALAGALAEGTYSFPVRCQMGDHSASAAIEFTVDRTAPTISQINDGNYTCGTDTISILVNTNNESISTYAYQVMTKGAIIPKNSGNDSNSSNSSSPAIDGLVLEGETQEDQPVTIDVGDLEQGSYFVRIKATDDAGNVGKFSESDGFSVTEKNHPSCISDTDAPLILTRVDDQACLQSQVQLICDDDVGCSEVLYGTSESSESCVVNASYTGDVITLDTSAWVCYEATDVLNQTTRGSQLIPFEDDDGDGVRNSCDLCGDTLSGSVVDNSGCADGEFPEEESRTDTDGDGLPDSWEKTYDRFDCPLNFASMDSNDNAVFDTDEDYDLDGKTNYEEYLLGTDPCVADDHTEKEEKPFDGGGFDPPTTQQDEFDLVAFILLLIGLLLIVGGSGYLVYYYLFTPEGKQLVTPTVRRPPRSDQELLGMHPGSTARAPRGAARPPSSKQLPSSQNKWKQKQRNLQRKWSQRVKKRKREQLFSAFGPKSSSIPHVDEALKSRRPHTHRVHDLAQKYAANKKAIRAGLHKTEKPLFSKLDRIAKKAKRPQDVDKNEAKDIMKKLRELSKKRKNSHA